MPHRRPFADLMERPFEVGPLVAHPIEEHIATSTGRSITHKVPDGRYYIWEVEGPDGFRLDLFYAVWANGERDVRPHFAAGGGAGFARLNSGSLRLQILPVPDAATRHHGRLFVAMRQAQIAQGPETAAVLRTVTEADLDASSGIDVADALCAVGGRAVGVREDVYGERNKSRAQPCVVFDVDDPRPAVAAFLVTRALPLWHAG